MKDNGSPRANRSAVLTFSAKDLGMSLREVAVDVIQNDHEDIESRWYHSAKDADLFLWKNESRELIKMQVTFYGQLIEWNTYEGLRTGLLIEDESSQEMGASPLIQYDLKPQKHAIEQGVEIVSHIPGLSADDKYQIIRNFMNTSYFSYLSEDEIWERFRVAKSKTGSSSAVSRWMGRAWGFLERHIKALGLSRKKK